MRVILAGITLVWTGVAQPETPPPEPTLIQLSLRARAARLAGDNAGWLEHGRATLARAPDHPDLLISASRAFAVNGHADDALDLLSRAIGRGARVDPESLPEYEALRGDSRFKALAGRAAANRRPVAPPEVFLVIEDTRIETEGITYDEDAARLFIGSLNGEIWQVDLEANLKRFAAPDTGLREVLGLKVDRKRRLLWAATGVFPDLFGEESKKDSGLTGVMALSLDDGRRERECWLDERPVEHGFNDLAIAANGDVYVSDSLVGAIYRLPGGECRLERVVQDSGMTFPNGIALSADDSLLYVAHVEGLSVVDLASGRRAALAVPETTALNSMDGLVRDGADLLGIQPSPYMARVVRIRLDDEGLAIRDVITASSPPPDGLSPATGVVAGPHYYSVASAPPGPASQDRRARILRAVLR